MEEDHRPLARTRGRSRLLDWVDALPPAVESAGGELTSRRLRDWELVLIARRVPHHLDRRTHQLLVPEHALERAVLEITSFEEENRHRPMAILPRRPNAWITLFVLLCLTIFHSLAERGWNPFGGPSLDWRQLGINNSELALLADQWWRPITALTLHADSAHLLGNLVFGGIVAVLLCREMGAGLGWFCIVTGGWAGNMVNNLARGPGHLSLGASTAVFAGVSILSGYRAFRSPNPDWRGVLLPLAAGVALLGIMGAGGERTDLGAHLFGFILGLFLGAGVGLLARSRGMPSSWTDKALGIIAALIPLVAWTRALLWFKG